MRVRAWVAGLLCAASLLVALVPVRGLCASADGGAFLVGGLRYRAGGVLRAMDAAPFLEEGRVFVRVRYLAAALGVPEDGVVWDPSDQSVVLTSGGTTLRLAVGSRVLQVNGRRVEMDVSPRLVPPGRVVLPARFVAEAFGYEVGSQAVLVGPPGRLPEASGVPRVAEARVLRAVDGDTLEVTDPTAEAGGLR